MGRACSKNPDTAPVKQYHGAFCCSRHGILLGTGRTVKVLSLVNPSFSFTQEKKNLFYRGILGRERAQLDTSEADSRAKHQKSLKSTRSEL